MADKKDKNNKDTKEDKASRIKGYEKLIEKLQQEREALQDEVTRDYKEARRYVRSHPEEGVLIGFVGGLALGVVLGRLMR